jgi:succinate dehydrogenase / fumarate reductase cytochrome b subunit
MSWGSLQRSEELGSVKAMKNRPLSPHLQIYKPQLTSMLSILHRITGVALSLGTLVLVYWLIAAAVGPMAFATAQAIVGSWLGRLLLFGWAFALFFHLCNGIRHLFWDAGYGFELKTVYASGRAAVIAAAALTLLSFIAGYAAMGAFS